MSQEDTMRLVAEVVDKFSGPLRDMNKRMHELQDVFKGAHTEGSKGAKEQAKAQAELRDRLVDTGRTVSGLVTPAMGVLGITFAGVGGSLAALVSQLKGASENFYKFQDASRRMGGLSASAIQGDIVAMGKFGVSADVALGSMAQFGDMRERLARQDPGELKRWVETFSNLGPLREQLAAAKTDVEAFDKAMDFLQRNQNIPSDQKSKLVDLLGLPPQLATATAKQLRDMREDAATFSKDHPVDMKQLEGLHASFEKLSTELKGLNVDVTSVFGGPAVTMIEGFSSAIKVVGQDMKDLRDLIVGDPKEHNNWLPEGGHWIDPKITDFFKNHHSSSGMPPSATSPDSSGSWTPAQKLGAGMSPVGFTTGSSDAENMLSRGVKSGMLAAFREWFASVSGNSAGAGSGMQNASFTTGGGLGGGGLGGSSPKFGNKDFPSLSGGKVPGGWHRNLAKALGMDRGGSGQTGDTSQTGGAFLKSQRAPYMSELNNNPALKRQLAALTTLEGNPANVTESLMNRLAYVNSERAKKNLPPMTVDQAIHSGFYGPVNRGQLPSAAASLSADRLAKISAAIDSVGNGRNVLKGATDQGMASDPNGRWLGGRVYGQDQVYNDWGGGPGGHEGARRFRESQQGQVNRDLLANNNAMTHKVEGNASVDVNFNNAPPGAKAYMKYGGMFKQGTTSWGTPMPNSDLAMGTGGNGL